VKGKKKKKRGENAASLASSVCWLLDALACESPDARDLVRCLLYGAQHRLVVAATCGIELGFAAPVLRAQASAIEQGQGKSAGRRRIHGRSIAPGLLKPKAPMPASAVRLTSDRTRPCRRSAGASAHRYSCARTTHRGRRASKFDGERARYGQRGVDIQNGRLDCAVGFCALAGQGSELVNARSAAARAWSRATIACGSCPSAWRSSSWVSTPAATRGA